MSLNDDAENPERNLWRKATLPLIAVFLAALFAAVCILSYLTSAPAAARVSRMLTSYLQQQLTVSAIQISGTTLIFKGISLANPNGFDSDTLASVASVTVAPDWWGLLQGKRSFRLLALEGARIDLRRNLAGDWNFFGLRHRMAGGKKQGTPLHIDQLVISNGSVLVNGIGSKAVYLRLRNLSTSGTTPSSIDLSFEDDAGDRFMLTGKGNFGTAPALALTLTAPEIHLESLVGILTPDPSSLPLSGKGSLRIAAEYRNGLVHAEGDLAFSQLAAVGRFRSPQIGRIALKGCYNLKQDLMLLEAAQLAVNGLFTVDAAGRMEGLKGEKRYSLNLDVDQIDLGRIAAAISAGRPSGLAINGQLRSTGLHLSGSARTGLDVVKGSLSLSNTRISAGNRLLADKLAGKATLSRTSAGIRLQGEMFQTAGTGDPLLQELKAPFSIIFSNRLKPIVAHVSPFSTRISGAAITGAFAMDRSRPVPMSFFLNAPDIPISSLNPVLAPFKLHFSGGTAAVALNGAGHGPADVTGTATAKVTDLEGEINTKQIALSGNISCRFNRQHRQSESSGNVIIHRLKMDNRKGDASFGFNLTERSISLNSVKLHAEGTELAIASMVAQSAPREPIGTMRQLPLSIEANGCDLRHGQVAISGLNTRLLATYHSDSTHKWLDGTADLASAGISRNGEKIGTLAARLNLERSGLLANISGNLLGGTVSGTIAVNPFTAGGAASFDLHIDNTELRSAWHAFSPSGMVQAAGGLLNVTARGGYESKKGLDCQLAADGKGIALMGKNGRTMVSGAAFRLSSAIDGRRMALKDANISTVEGAVFHVTGEISKEPGRQLNGDLNITLNPAQADRLLESFVNILPRFLQDATVAGTIAAEAKLGISGERKLLNGEIRLAGVRLDSQPHKFGAGPMAGTIPFSFKFPGIGPFKAVNPVSVRRNNFHRLTEAMRLPVPGSNTLAVERISFGPIEFGATAVDLRAANGITEIQSLRSSLFRGEVMGKGFAYFRNGFKYGGDLIVKGLSLEQGCRSFPEFKGYISGRLNSIISLANGDDSGSGMLGIIDVWASESTDEKMRISKELLQRLASRNLSGFLFRDDRPYDRAEIRGILENGILTFEELDISHTNIFGIRDLSVTVVSDQNRIALDHLIGSIKQAAERGKRAKTKDSAPVTPSVKEFRWDE